MAPSGTPTKGERTRLDILRAAEKRFARRGFAETRLDEVAADLGLAPSAILYHFADKRQLYRAVLDQLFSGLLDELRHILGRRGTLAERIEHMAVALVDYAARHPEAAHITLREAATTDPELRADIRAQSAPFLALLAQVFAEGERKGVLRPIRTDPFHFVSALAGTLVFYVAALPTFVPDLPYDHLAPEQVEVLKRDIVAITRRLLGIGGPRRTPPGKRSAR